MHALVDAVHRSFGVHHTPVRSLHLWVAAFKTRSFTLLYLPLDKAQAEHLLCSSEQSL